MNQQAAHVYQRGNIPWDAADNQYARYVTYGQKFSAAIFRDAFIHDAPADEDQKKWIQEDLAPRIAPGGSIRYLESPSLRSTNGAYR